MIDIHAHILPSLDDGPKDLISAIEMAKKAEEDGIKKVIATPHVISGEFDLSRETILATVKAFNNELKKHDVAIEVYPGAENYLDFSLVQRAKDGQIMTLSDNGTYILVELPMQSFPHYTEQIMFELMLLGLTPIIAHPERNLAIGEDPSFLFSLISKGVLAQVNANSLTGAFGKTVANTAKLFIEHNWVHFLATDCHSCGVRGPRLRETFTMVSEIVGKNKAEELTLINPQKVIDGEVIMLEDIKEYSPNKGIWGRIKSKLF